MPKTPESPALKVCKMVRKPSHPTVLKRRDGSRLESAEAVDRIPVRRMPGLFYAFFVFVIVVSVAVMIMAVKGRRPASARESQSVPVPVRQNRPPRAPPPFPGRRWSPGQPAGATSDDGGKFVAVLRQGHAYSSFMRALHLRLDGESDLILLPDRELDVLRAWQARALELGDGVRARLDPIGRTDDVSAVRMRVSLDGQTPDGVVTMRRRGDDWIVVGATREERKR